MMFNQFLRDILYIIEGYFYWVKDKIMNKINPVSVKRLSICKDCEHNIHGICQLCGCVLKAKARVDFMLDEDGLSIDGCPKKKW